MSVKNLEGRIIILTRYLEQWYKELNTDFNVPVCNRLAKIIKIFDWDSDEGKLVLSEREKTGKWDNLNSKEFKYVIKVYYPELRMNNKRKIAVTEIVPQYYPKTKNLMFYPMPFWMLKDLNKEEKNIFEVQEKKEDKS